MVVANIVVAKTRRGATPQRAPAASVSCVEFLPKEHGQDVWRRGGANGRTARQPARRDADCLPSCDLDGIFTPLLAPGVPASSPRLGRHSATRAQRPCLVNHVLNRRCPRCPRSRWTVRSRSRRSGRGLRGRRFPTEACHMNRLSEYRVRSRALLAALLVMLPAANFAGPLSEPLVGQAASPALSELRSSHHDVLHTWLEHEPTGAGMAASICNPMNSSGRWHWAIGPIGRVAPAGPRPVCQRSTRAWSCRNSAPYTADWKPGSTISRCPSWPSCPRPSRCSRVVSPSRRGATGRSSAALASGPGHLVGVSRRRRQRSPLETLPALVGPRGQSGRNPRRSDDAEGSSRPVGRRARGPGLAAVCGRARRAGALHRQAVLGERGRGTAHVSSNPD